MTKLHFIFSPFHRLHRRCSLVIASLSSTRNNMSAADLPPASSYVTNTQYTHSFIQTHQLWLWCRRARPGSCCALGNTNCQQLCSGEIFIMYTVAVIIIIIKCKKTHFAHIMSLSERVNSAWSAHHAGHAPARAVIKGGSGEWLGSIVRCSLN